jgi:hypothetical protein
MMFHDALAQWNEGETQAYLEEKYPGFTSRFIKPVGKTCAGTIYKDKPPGNSPENARGLDSYGFADLEYAMCFNCALSWVYPYGDPRRIFGQWTPKEVWHLMVETWTVVGAPSIARITEDISGLYCPGASRPRQACSRLTSRFRVASYCRRVDLECD